MRVTMPLLCTVLWITQTADDQDLCAPVPLQPKLNITWLLTLAPRVTLFPHAPIIVATCIRAPSTIVSSEHTFVLLYLPP